MVNKESADPTDKSIPSEASTQHRIMKRVEHSESTEEEGDSTSGISETSTKSKKNEKKESTKKSTTSSVQQNTQPNVYGVEKVTSNTKQQNGGDVETNDPYRK